MHSAQCSQGCCSAMNFTKLSSSHLILAFECLLSASFACLQQSLWSLYWCQVPNWPAHRESFQIFQGSHAGVLIEAWRLSLEVVHIMVGCNSHVLPSFWRCTIFTREFFHASWLSIMAWVVLLISRQLVTRLHCAMLHPCFSCTDVGQRIQLTIAHSVALAI